MKTLFRAFLPLTLILAGLPTRVELKAIFDPSGNQAGAGHQGPLVTVVIN